MTDPFNETHVLDLLPVYAIGGLDSDEARQVEEHLTGCLICRSESSSFQAVADEFTLTVPHASPSPALKDRLMQRVHSVNSARPQGQEPVSSAAPARPFWERLLPAWGLASLFLILALGTSSLFLWQRLTQLEFATAPGGMRAVPLNATDAAPDATGFVLISADGDDGALVVDGLPPLGESQQYQLWLIRDGHLRRDTDQRQLIDYSTVGITIEPAGGSPEPTGQQVLAGTLPQP